MRARAFGACEAPLLLGVDSVVDVARSLHSGTAGSNLSLCAQKFARLFIHWRSVK